MGTMSYFTVLRVLEYILRTDKIAALLSKFADSSLGNRLSLIFKNEGLSYKEFLEFWIVTAVLLYVTEDVAKSFGDFINAFRHGLETITPVA